MNFPDHVPQTVREYYSQLLQLRAILPPDRLECIDRLVGDQRMKDAYELLASAFADEGKDVVEHRIVDFIDAAWCARTDFTRYRNAMKQAKKINQEIADTATKLAMLLRSIPSGIDAPHEFSSVCRLLELTDNPRDPMWALERSIVTATQTEPPAEGAVVIWLPDNKRGPKAEQPEDSPVRIYDPDNPPPVSAQPPNPDPKWQLRRAWGRSPFLADLLDTLSHVARSSNPQAPSEMIEAAISSRKSTALTAYLRAFGSLLTEAHGFEMRASVIIRAMATTAVVAINDPDVDVTYDDVRKACERLG